MNEIIVDTSPTRSIEQLNEEEKRRVESKLASLDYMNPVSIIQFGSESSKEVTSLSTEMISKFKVKDFEDAQELIVNLVGDLKTVDPKTLLETKKKGIFSRMSLGKKAEEKIAKMITQQTTLEKAIDEVENKLVAAKISLMGDLEFCSQMTKKTYEFAKNQEIDYLTIQEAIKSAKQEKQKLEELFARQPNNIEYSYKIAELNRSIERLEQKAINILSFRTSTLQSVVQIGLVQGGDELMVSKIDDTITNIIPSWKRNFAIGIATYRLNNAVAIQKMCSNATNELLKRNSEMLKDTLLETATELQRPSIDPETLEAVNQNLEETFKGLSKVSEEASKNRKEAIDTIQSIQNLAIQLQSGTALDRLEDRNEKTKRI